MSTQHMSEQPHNPGFIMWACGHAHQQTPDGRVPTCHPNPAWYILECGDRPPPAVNSGLRPDDYTLHALNPVDQTYSAARSVSDPFALEVADRAGRRLMIYSREREQWIPVLA